MFSRADYQKVWRLFETISGHRMSWPFKEPIDPTKYPGYTDVVQKPMGKFFFFFNFLDICTRVARDGGFGKRSETRRRVLKNFARRDETRQFWAHLARTRRDEKKRKYRPFNALAPFLIIYFYVTLINPSNARLSTNNIGKVSSIRSQSMVSSISFAGSYPLNNACHIEFHL